MPENKIFVYGSLMEGFFNYNKYLVGHSLHIEPAYTFGKLYDMPYKGYPALLDGIEVVHGQIITIKHLDSLLPSLDALEKYSSSDNDEYQRQYREVFDQHGNSLLVYCYIYQVQNDSQFYKDAIHLKDGNWGAYMKEKKD
jgi:gamma-glutamylcyclotransferase (GGCT)/AIG2-like uncharacterized protein YtfP